MEVKDVGTDQYEKKKKKLNLIKHLCNLFQPYLHLFSYNLSPTTALSSHFVLFDIKLKEKITICLFYTLIKTLRTDIYVIFQFGLFPFCLCDYHAVHSCFQSRRTLPCIFIALPTRAKTDEKKEEQIANEK